ncbi:tyrosine-type recombinase/integrase [Laribacter hongkongensis]|uniref:tyrosine-type recombinase/integrase n=1 Tax=Laribacter hongkongensis TaxID=168471 RepID=UPI001D0CA230|nr:integrase family protein [Laribacter hongkongensis]
MFDARAAKSLEPGQHLTSPEHPGLRLEASTRYRSWIYRYRNSSGELKQIKIGTWPAMSVHAAIVEWERLRVLRDSGVDPAAERKAARVAKAVATARKKLAAQNPYRVIDLCQDYWNGHVRVNRVAKGATETWRIFDTMLGDFADVEASSVTRSQAFDLIKSYAESAPVQAIRLRAELGAAWDYAIDSGRLPESTPNWWRHILRGKIKSKGKAISGQRVGVVKRALSPDEASILLKWLPNFSKTIHDVLIIYMWTCTRGAEIVAMRGSEIHVADDGQWWWTIPKEKTKNARLDRATDLRVPLFGRALAVIQRRCELHGSGYLFPVARPSRISEHVLQKTIQAGVFYHQPYCKTTPQRDRPRLPVTHWAPHDLRRSSRTFLARLGCPSEVAESITGHILPGVAGVYNQYSYDAERIEWLRKLSDYLEQLASC